MYKQLGGASVLLRHFARMHEIKALYRQAEHALREFKLNDTWYIKPTERDGRGWGATEAIRGALCHWIEVQGGKIKNYQIVAPTTWNVGPRMAIASPWTAGPGVKTRQPLTTSTSLRRSTASASDPPSSPMSSVGTI